MINPDKNSVVLDNDEYGDEPDSLKDWLLALPELQPVSAELVNALNNSTSTRH